MKNRASIIMKIVTINPFSGTFSISMEHKNDQRNIGFRGRFSTKFDVFRSNCTEMNITRLLRSLITILTSKMKNSTWQNQYGVTFLPNSTFSLQIAQN